MILEEMKESEKKITEMINEQRKKWFDKYGQLPDRQMTCFDVVQLLAKLGLIND
jgi:hypothetical protein